MRRNDQVEFSMFDHWSKPFLLEELSGIVQIEPFASHDYSQLVDISPEDVPCDLGVGW